MKCTFTKLALHGLLFAIVLIAKNSNASDSLVLTGIESSKNNSYYYLGYINSLNDSKLGNGYIQRLWVDYLTYEYSNGTSDINAYAPGISYSLGYQKTKEKYAWGGYIGIQARNTNLSPDDPGNKLRGNRGSIVVAVDGKHQVIDQLFVELMGNYAPDTGYWSRARIPFGIAMKTGPEYSIQGNPNYQNQKIGWFISDIDIGERFKGGIKTGYSKNNGLGGSIYLGLEINKYLP